MFNEYMEKSRKHSAKYVALEKSGYAIAHVGS